MTEVDYAVIGEGEITNCELAYALDHGKDTEHIPGLVIKKDEGYVYTGERKYIKDLDSVAFPSYEGLDLDKYLDNQTVDGWYHMYGAFSDDPRIMPMCLARSCPFLCKFCFHPIGRGYRSRSMDNFFEELDLWIEQYHINAIALVDECFSIKPERVIEFCKRIKPYKIAWECQMRVETYSAELIKIMVDAGCVQAAFGVENMSQKILDDMNKHTTTEQLQKAMEISYQCGGAVGFNILYGAAAEDIETFRETTEWRKHNKKYQANCFMVGTYPGSGYYSDAVRDGIIKDRKQFIANGCPNINITQLSERQYRMLESYARFRDKEIHNRGKIVSVKDTEEGINAVLECKHCGYQNHYKKIRSEKWVNGELTLKNIMCRKCHNYSDYISESSMLKESWNVADWLYDGLVGNKNHKLENYMKKHRYSKVAIYGMGLALEGVTTFLMEELKRNHIEIAYGIDRKPDLFQGKSVPVLGINDLFPEVDVIIVTAIYSFASIFCELRKKTDLKIISLEDIFS